MKKRKIRLTAISTFHFIRLVYRSILFLAAAAFYIAYRFTNDERISVHLDKLPAVLAVIWVVYVVEMVLRFFPSRLESPGCQKQFARCAYAVCDMICILFFCPFQTWFLKNKCCSACRIYNWDYAMMFTPLFFVRAAYSWSLFALSLVLLLRWEITFYRHPEWFSERTNAYLHCANCKEKLCTHKTQLHSLWKQVEAFTAERIRRLKQTEERIIKR